MHTTAPASQSTIAARVPTDLKLSLLAGSALLIGWTGQTYFGLPFWLALALYLVAYVAGGLDATRHAWRAARRGRFDIDFLMVVAALGSAALGAWAEGALLLFLFSLGHSLEHYAMARARGAITALDELVPETATVRRDGAELTVKTSALKPGDTVLVRPGTRIPADGEVGSGSSEVNQAAITGESMPAAVTVGSKVFAGTVNGSGALEVNVTGLPGDTALARIIDTVTEARSNKAPSQRFADRFLRIFTPVVLTVTVLVAVVPPLFGQPFSESFRRALVLLVAASPCALALATPSAVLAGIAKGARSGVVFKGGAPLEGAATIRALAFDKTGTLTSGRPQLTDIVPLHGDGDGLLALAAAAESQSGHPLALALTEAARTRGLEVPAATDLVSLDGRGLRAKVGKDLVTIGNDRLLRELDLAAPEPLATQADALTAAGKTLAYVVCSDQVSGVLAFRDEPRPEAASALARLRSFGVSHLAMLTGDNRAVAEAAAGTVGITDVRAELLPDDKLAAIDDLKRSHGRVAMVGDGVNDAPALIRADLGIAMGGAGTDLAVETAGIVLMSDGLGRLPFALELSRATRSMIVQNLAISLGVIILLVPSAILGWAQIGWAIVLHEMSTLVVVANALRLLGFRGSRPLQ